MILTGPNLLMPHIRVGRIEWERSSYLRCTVGMWECQNGNWSGQIVCGK